MVCTNCHKAVEESANYCSSCGARQRPRVAYKQLMLSRTDSKIAGVCGGLAEYLDVDPTIVRLGWIALSVVPGGVVGGVIAYVLAWIVIPKAPALESTASGAIPAQPSA